MSAECTAAFSARNRVPAGSAVQCGCRSPGRRFRVLRQLRLGVSRHLLQRGVHFPAVARRETATPGEPPYGLRHLLQRGEPAQRSGLPQRSGFPSRATGARGARGANPNSFGFIPLRANRNSFRFFSLREPKGGGSGECSSVLAVPGEEKLPNPKGSAPVSSPTGDTSAVPRPLPQRVIAAIQRFYS